MRGRTVVFVGAALVGPVLAGAVMVGGGHLATAVPTRPVNAAPTGLAAQAEDKRPNIVLVLMDDFSLELLATMPQAQRMRATGASYRNAHVVDSLCCPSAAAMWDDCAPARCRAASR